MLWHYRIQLNIYAWILRQYYDLRATDLRVVCLHPDNGFTAHVVSVALMPEHMNKLMSWRRDDLQSCMGLTKIQANDLRAGSRGCFVLQVEGRLTHRMLDPVSVVDLTAGSHENGHFFTQAGSQDDSHEAKMATHDLRAGKSGGCVVLSDARGGSRHVGSTRNKC